MTCSESRDNAVSFSNQEGVAALTFAVRERNAAAFLYLVAPGDSIRDTTLNRWAHKVAAAVRQAIAKG
jgi:hypothetical protein